MFQQQTTAKLHNTKYHNTTDKLTDISLQEGSHVVAQVRGHQRRRSLTGTQSKEWKERIAQDKKHIHGQLMY